MADLIPPRLDRVPAALASCDQWLVWKAVEKTKKDPITGELVTKITKVPYNPNNGRQASTTRPDSWGTFDQAANAYVMDGFDGIGFVFSPNDDFIGVDLDNCFDADGNLRADAQQAIRQLDSYTEMSPGGTGLHIICRGRLPGSGHCDKARGREMYQEGRFFTITAEVVEEKAEVYDRRDEARVIYEEWFGKHSLESYTAGDLEWDDDAPIVDLDDLSVSDYTRNLVVNGEGIEDFVNDVGVADRSSALFFVCREMVSAGATKESVMTILTDAGNYLAQPALERRGGNIQSARDWVWKYTLAKVVAHWEEEAHLFNDVIGDGDDGEEFDFDNGVTPDAGGEAPKGDEKQRIPFEDKNFEKNALLFLKHHPMVRFNKEFFVYNGKYWKPVGEEIVDRDVHTAMRGRKFSMSQINNTLTTVKRFATKDTFTPSATMVTFNNGVVDLAGWDSGMVYLELKDHDRRYKSLSCLNFNFDPETQCPTWLRFLNSTFEEDQQRIRLLQQWLGYLLVYDYRWQKMMVMVGQSRSGKGVITGVIRELVGVDGYAGTSLSNMSGEFGLEALQHAKVAVIGDAHHGMRDRINTAKERLLNVTGADSVPVNRKHKGEITCQIPARLMLLANDLPRFADGHDALSNRYLVLPFNVSFAGREDVTLSQRLKTELPGIFNWAVDGLLDLALSERFVEPELSAERKEEIRMHQNPVAWFTKKFLSPCNNPDNNVAVDNLYAAYAAFCDHIDSRPLKKVGFGKALKAHAPFATHSRPRINGVRTPSYVGVTVDQEALADFTDDDLII